MSVLGLEIFVESLRPILLLQLLQIVQPHLALLGCALVELAAVLDVLEGARPLLSFVVWGAGQYFVELVEAPIHISISVVASGRSRPRARLPLLLFFTVVCDGLLSQIEPARLRGKLIAVRVLGRVPGARTLVRLTH